VDTADALRDLSVRYASAVDRRDGDALAALFSPDAVLTVVPGPDSSRSETQMVGRPEIRELPGQVAAFRRTFHLLGQSHYDVHGSTASGEVYCVAHHLGEDSNYVMYIRYQDRYSQSGDEEWRIDQRRVQIDWTERRSLR